MAGNVQNVLGFLRVTEKRKPAAKVIGPAGMPVTSSAELERGNNGNREIVLGRNLKSSSFRISEPDDKDALDGKPDMVGIIDKYKEYLAERTKHQLGFPCNLEFEYGALSQFLPFSINNLGDPFIDSNYGIHSKQFELGVLDWFARLWELEENEYWGYITGGGTEGNLHGILIGRETFPDGILYASRDSHYSVFKASKIYRMDCVKVKTLVSGEIDCSDFRACLLQNIQRPAIVNVNIGTTVKGAIDDLNLVIKVLEQSGFNNRFYIHCDGALLGLMLPFMKHAPKLTFKKAIGSVSISGHKFVGTPFPCGVQITRMSHMSALSGEVELISSKDNTVMGSRNGHAPLYLWYGLKRSGYQGLRNEVDKCLHNARFLESRLREAGIGAMRNELSNIVVFERPQDVDFIRKWQLLCEGNIAHVVVMPNVTLEKLSVFAEDLVESRRVWLRDGEISPPCIEAEVGHENCACLLHLHE